MRARDRQNEVVVAVIVISALALALTFGLVLSLGSRSNDNSDDTATNTSDTSVLVGNITRTSEQVDGTEEPSPIEGESPTVVEDDTLTPTAPESTETDVPSLTSEPTETPTKPIEPSDTSSPEASATDTASPSDTSTPTPRVSVSTLTPTLQVITEVVTLTPRAEATTQVATATTRSGVELSTIVLTLTPTVEPTTQVPTSRSQVELSTEVVTLTPTSTIVPTTVRPNVEVSIEVVTLTPAHTATPMPSSTPTLEVPTADETVFPTPTITPFEVIMVTATPDLCEPPDDWVPYVVQFGDTLFLIASQAGLQTDTLRQANCIEGDRILAGQTLYVPPGTTIINTPLATQASRPATCPYPGIQITYPYPGDILTDSLIVRGIATGEFFGYFQLQLRPENAVNYQPIFISDQRVLFESQLGPITLSSSFVPGNYILRLQVFNRWGNAVGQCDIPVQIR